MKAMKALALAVAVMAIALAVGWAASLDTPAEARGNGLPDGAKRVYSFNLIGFPEGQEYTGGCGAGHRIFVNRNANHGHILVHDHDDGWHVEDCNATADNRGELHTDDLGTFDVYVRILGKPGGSLKICANTLEDHDVFGVDDPYCLVGEFTLNREGGQSRFAIQPDAIFDAELEDLIWSVTTHSDFRIAQFVVVQTP